jgi:hypothetical protein
MSDDTRPEDQSDIPILNLPEGGFKSKIPASLLADKSPEERDLYNDISKISAWVDWAAPLMVDSNLQQRRTNGRVKRLEANVGEVDVQKLQKFKDMFTSWWALVGGLVLLVGGIASVGQLIEFAKNWLAK